MTGGLGEPDEELDLGARTRWSAGLLARFGWRWRAGAAVVVVAAVAIPLIVMSRPRAPSTTPRPSPPPPVSLPKPPVPANPTAREIHPFLLGIHRSWELFGRAEGNVVRIEFARGRITTTPVPPLQSTGPVFFVVGPHSVLIRPLDFVPGYLIPDGKHARTPARPLDCGGPALPGPRPGTVWVARCGADEPSPRLLLTRFDGVPTGISAPVPGGNSPIEVLPDGQGYLLFPGAAIGSVASFDIRPGRALTTFDRVVAIGPTRWLVQSCAHDGRCHGYAVVDRTNGRQRRLAATFAGHLAPGEISQGPGIIAPDGSSAVLPARSARAAFVYVDLASGAYRDLPVQRTVADEQTMAWSPDSKWLFVLSGRGVLYAVDGRTGRIVTDLTEALHLPLLEQLAIRAAAPS